MDGRLYGRLERYDNKKNDTEKGGSRLDAKQQIWQKKMVT